MNQSPVNPEKSGETPYDQIHENEINFEVNIKNQCFVPLCFQSVFELRCCVDAGSLCPTIKGMLLDLHERTLPRKRATLAEI